MATLTKEIFIPLCNTREKYNKICKKKLILMLEMENIGISSITTWHECSDMVAKGCIVVKKKRFHENEESDTSSTSFKGNFEGKKKISLETNLSQFATTSSILYRELSFEFHDTRFIN